MSASLFLALLKREKLPAPEPEFRFHPVRRWRFDWAFPPERVAVEVEGGAWTRGRHTRGAGFIGDCEKYSVAATLGWRIIRVTPDQLCTLRTIEWIRQALEYGRAA